MAENEQVPRPTAAGKVEQALADANASNQDGQAEGQAAPDQQAQHGEVRAANAPANEFLFIFFSFYPPIESCGGFELMVIKMRSRTEMQVAPVWGLLYRRASRFRDRAYRYSILDIVLDESLAFGQTEPNRGMLHLPRQQSTERSPQAHGKLWRR
ncbi:hypothetical protein QZH41_019132, partial [Actinostola sp. cb2023]